MLLVDPAYTVPDPGPAGPFGTMAWLRATVSRFCEGETHARRRALVESLLADLDPAELREAAAETARPRAVQACEATAGLVRGDELPVPVTRRVGPERSGDERAARGGDRTVLVSLAGHPFGAGPRRCPGEAHALALVDGVLGR